MVAKNYNSRILLAIIGVFLFTFLINSKLIASDGAESAEFNAGETIIHHVLDAHEIHFFTLNEGKPDEFHASIPLPIILYSADNGVEIFSSAKFHNEEHKHGRYIMHHEKIYIANSEGVLELDEKGHAHNAQPLDFSLTKSALGGVMVMFAMLFIFLSIAKSYKKRGIREPKGLQSFIEPIIIFIRDDVAKPCIGAKHEKFMPYLLSIFFFIWLCNLLGLIPFIGGFNITGNIAATLVLAVFTFIVTTFSGNKNYWQHIFAMPGVPPLLWILLTPIEIMGMLTKPVVLMLRLFANIVAGHIAILSFVSLIFIFAGMYGAAAGFGVSIVSLVFAMFINVIEILVAFLQAYVFTLLSAIYFGSAVEEHHDAH